jgi:uncharacterized membrane protein YkvA (DUF1232 family)
MKWLQWPALVRTLVLQCRLATRLLREPRVSLATKALPVGVVLYLILPFDISPDLIPVIGQLDDIVVAILGLEAFLYLCPRDAVAYHREAIARRRKYSPMPNSGDFIDVEWRRED